MIKIHVDQIARDVREGVNLLEACLELGYDLPYFCWHPSLGSVGACRQCAVKQFKDEKDTRGKIVMACMTPAAAEARISIDDAEARAFRASVIEWLMVNHPHDCPVCDEGGECHLQDVTVMTGHAYRRCRFKKRTFRNQDLGPFVNHEMNRCIACYRCVRFYRDYAGGHDFNVFATHDHVYFGRHEDGILENEFSGNLVEVCPTGVFTDKSLKRHYTRKWDLQTAPSVCGHCSLGCNTIPGERYGSLRRVRNRYHAEVNGYFLCDRGRYGYEYVNSERRIRKIWVKRSHDGVAQTASKDKAIAVAASGRLIGIGSPRASLEANFALKTLVGPDRFHAGVSDVEFRLLARALEVLKSGPVPSATLAEAEKADAVLVLGEDVTQTAPRLALALRQAVLNEPKETVRDRKIPTWQDAAVREAIQDKKGPLFVAASYPTKLDEVASSAFHAAPENIARLGHMIAHVLSKDAAAVPGADEPLANRALLIAQTLRKSKRPLIVAGTNCGSEQVIQAAANVAWALYPESPEARLFLVCAEANSLGLALLGGKPLEEAFRAIEGGSVENVIVLENDLFRRAEADRVGKALAKAKNVVLIDHTASAMVPRSTVILPAATFAESAGTFMNNEGRAQRYDSVFVPDRLDPDRQIQESWRWLRELSTAGAGSEAEPWNSLEDVVSRIVMEMPSFKGLTHVSPGAGFRIAGMKIPREPHRYSGRTAMHANITVHEPKPPVDADSPLAFSMEGDQGEPPAPLVSRYWAPKWNSVQALNKFQAEIAGPMRGGPMGVRLLEARADAKPRFYRDVPAAFEPRPGKWLAVPVHHIFGSDELSALSPGIAALAPRPYVALSPEDASRLGVQADQLVQVQVGRANRSLPVHVLKGLPAGLIGIPVGLPGMDGIDVSLPRWLDVVLQPIAGAA